MGHARDRLNHAGHLRRPSRFGCLLGLVTEGQSHRVTEALDGHWWRRWSRPRSDPRTRERPPDPAGPPGLGRVQTGPVPPDSAPVTPSFTGGTGGVGDGVTAAGGVWRRCHSVIRAVRRVTELADRAAERRPRLGQLAGPDHEQSDDQDDDQVCWCECADTDLPTISGCCLSPYPGPKSASTTVRPPGRFAGRCRPGFVAIRV